MDSWGIIILLCVVKIFHNKIYEKKYDMLGLPCWPSGCKSACQCKECQVQSLVQEDSTCHGAPKPQCHNYCVYVPRAPREKPLQ